MGSLRVSFKDSLGIAKVTQESHTGIFGEILPSLIYTNTPKTDNFDYTGHERLKTFNLGYIDAGARLYDPLVPRFTTLDPLAELSRRFSPTVYGNANPVRFIDPDGMKAKGYVSASGYYSDDDGAGGEQENGLEEKREVKRGNDDDDKDKGKKKSNSTATLATGAALASGTLTNGGTTALTIEEIIALGSVALRWSPLGLMFLMEGDTPHVGDIAIPNVRTKRDTDDYVFLYRNTDLAEISSYTRKGFNFGFSSNSLGAKEFWYTPDGLFDWLQSETFSKDYVITVAIPKSIIGKIVNTQVLDGHLAGVVYPTNMNSFNKAKTTVSIIKVK